MNLAQELLQLEKQKETLLNKSQNITAQYYFCFITTTPIQFGIPSKSTTPKRMGVRINCEIIDFHDVKNKQFNSFDLTFTIRMQKSDNKDKLTFDYSGGNQHKTLKSINANGLFFINNYSDLSDKQKKESIKKIEDYYEKAQDPYYSWAIPSLSVNNIVGYLKKSKLNCSLDEFLNDLSNQLENFIIESLSTFVIEETYQNWYDKEIEKIYTFTAKDKKSLIKHIHKNLKNNIIEKNKKEVTI